MTQYDTKLAFLDRFVPSVQNEVIWKTAEREEKPFHIVNKHLQNKIKKKNEQKRITTFLFTSLNCNTENVLHKDNSINTLIDMK